MVVFAINCKDFEKLLVSVPLLVHVSINVRRITIVLVECADHYTARYGWVLTVLKD